MSESTVTSYIGVGSNIDPETNIEHALSALGQHVRIEAISTFYRTKPLLGRRQPDYLNGVWKISTGIPLPELKTGVLSPIENELGRIRTADAYAARTIDLDILLYGDMVADGGEITVPDHDITTRPFIAIPLYELAPGLVLPGTGTPLSEIARNMNTESMIADIPFTERLRRIIS